MWQVNNKKPSTLNYLKRQFRGRNDDIWGLKQNFIYCNKRDVCKKREWGAPNFKNLLN